MTARFDAFKEELVMLLNKHGLMLHTSLDDKPAVSLQDPEEPEPIWMGDLADETGDG